MQAPLLILLFLIFNCVTCSLPPLVVFTEGDNISNGRYLAQKTENGQVPFFWLGDTPWELPRALNMSDVNLYLKDRKEKGYNVLQVAAVFFDDVQTPNYYGDYAFAPNHSDPTQPNEAFFKNVDQVFAEATSQGFYLAVWPIWGSAYISPGGSPQFLLIFNINSSFWFGNWIGQRYKDYSSIFLLLLFLFLFLLLFLLFCFDGLIDIVWVLGGDTDFPLTDSQLGLYRAMAEGIATGVTGGPRPSWNQSSPVWDSLLMSYHPRSGYSSSLMFENDAWLDFNLIQSGWGLYTDIQPLVGGDYLLPLVKPTFMGEGAYEDDIYNITTDTWGVRLNGYWNVLSGAFGHTYGANGVYQFQIGNTSDTPDWHTALNFPGSSQMQWIKKVFTFVKFWELIPDLKGVILPLQGDAKNLTRILAKNYTTYGYPITVNCNYMPLAFINYTWVNPQTGVFSNTTHYTNPRSDYCTFVTPSPPAYGNDWILILQSSS